MIIAGDRITGATSRAESLPHKLIWGSPIRSISQNGRAARFLRGQAPKGARPTSQSSSGGGCYLNREARRLDSRDVA